MRTGRAKRGNPLSLKQIGKGIGILLATTLVLTITFGAGHLGMNRLIGWLDLQPQPLVGAVLGSLAGLLVLAVFGTTMATIFRGHAWAQQMNLFSPLLQAMEQIARGDFSVRLERPMERHPSEPLYQLFEGMNNMAQQLKQLETMRQEFISNVSHEIQSPLTSIRGFAHALQTEDLPATTRHHYLDIIETESMRLAKLSDNLLALAALDAETMHLDSRPYRLDKQIRRVILACEPQWAAKALEMNVILAEVTITADEDLLSQVWGNLLHNSIKFTPANGNITIQLQQRADRVEVCLQDSGIGIAPEDQIKLFERFFKADKARNRTLGGNGLGLAIVKKIVDLHQGTIHVESALDAGASFTITLPITPAR